MKLVNISTKIINIRNTALLPDDSMEITEADAVSGPIRAFEKLKYISLENTIRSNTVNVEPEIKTVPQPDIAVQSGNAQENATDSVKQEKKSGRQKIN